MVDRSKPDEGFWLEKRDGRRFHKAKLIQHAEVLESNIITAKIVFHDPRLVRVFDLNFDETTGMPYFSATAFTGRLPPGRISEF